MAKYFAVRTTEFPSINDRWKLNFDSFLTASVSQFTLFASVKKGNKPDFHQSASGEKAKALYTLFYNTVGELYEPQKVKDGVFAAMR